MIHFLNQVVIRLVEIEAVIRLVRSILDPDISGLKPWEMPWMWDLAMPQRMGPTDVIKRDALSTDHSHSEHVIQIRNTKFRKQANMPVVGNEDRILS